jgi:hypothetical protein
VPDSVLVYIVRAEFADAATRERYFDWLREGHALAVVREGGALSGEVTVLEGGSALGGSALGGSALGGSALGVVESRYMFESREAFEAYEAGPGVALRADGARLFPPDSGVRTTRILGVRAVRVPD